MNHLKRILHSSRLILRAIAPYKARILFLLGISLLEAISSSFSIVLLIPFLDMAMGKQSYSFLDKLLLPLLEWAPKEHHIAVLVVIMFSMMAIKCTLSVLSKYLAASFAMRLSEQWSNQLHKFYLGRRFDLSVKGKQGEALHKIVGEPPMASKFLISVVEYCSKIIFSIVMIAVLIAIDWQITLSMGVVGGLLWFCLSRVAHPYSNTLGKDRIEAQQAILTQASENISGQAVIKAFSLIGAMQQRFEKASARSRRVLIRFRMVNAIPTPAGEFLVFSAIIAIVFATTQFEPQRVQTKLPVIAVMVICGQKLISSLSFLMTHSLDIAFRLPAITMLHKALYRHALQQEPKDGWVVDRLQGEIKLKNVSFSYGSDTCVLKDLNVVFPIGKMSAIVGPSGIGKSTIIHLLMGMLKPTSGVILVNNKSLSDYQLDSWRSRIGYVGQDPFLFHGTIRDNIRMGRLDATDHEIEDAARAAAIHDTIMAQPKGYDTLVGDRGMTLSGGQKQRVSIARAMVRDPDIYLFDEATSALDHESEKLIQQAMCRLSQSKTVIVVAHRLSTIEHSDAVFDLRELQRETVNQSPPSLIGAPC